MSIKISGTSGSCDEAVIQESDLLVGFAHGASPTHRLHVLAVRAGGIYAVKDRSVRGVCGDACSICEAVPDPFGQLSQHVLAPSITNDLQIEPFRWHLPPRPHTTNDHSHHPSRPRNRKSKALTLTPVGAARPAPTGIRRALSAKQFGAQTM
jgi:hypothetical protein